MKYARKLIVFLICIAMMLSFATTAFAYDLELTGDLTKGHTYNVYQIFTGDLDEVGGETVLANVKYGSIYPAKPADPVTGTKYCGDIVPAEELEAITDASAFVKELTLGTVYGTLNKDNNWSLTNVSAGYYLIKDVTDMSDKDNEDLEINNSLSQYIVQVVDDISMTPKADKLIPGKEINSDDHADDYGNDDSVSADATTNNGGLGSTVKFDLTVKVPKNADKYTYYYCILNDTLSKGLTFNNDVVVTIDGKTATAGTDYVLYTGEAAEGKTFQVAMLDAASLAGKTIVATYTATINEDAIIGVEGNPNDFTVKYSNDPNHDYDDKPENPDGKPDEGDNDPLGETPVITTRTYVTALQVLKIDAATQEALAGAEFQLSGTSIQKVIVTGIDYEVDENGTYYKLTDGSYTDEAPRTETTYVQKDQNDRDGGYVKNGDSYKVATDAQLADPSVTLYKKLSPNANKYENTSTKYKQIVVDEVKENAQDVTITAFVDDNGIVRFTGLGEGKFILTELTAPSGYNMLEDPIEISIDWTAPTAPSTDCTWVATADGETLSTVEVTVTETVGEGEDAKTETKTFHVFELKVENNKGTKLPETGGIGTTLFYIMGSALAVAAVILLVTKKRMSSAQ